MNARKKINSAAINGSLIVAGLAGYLFGSWWVFVITATLLIVSAINNGDIRHQPTRRSRK